MKIGRNNPCPCGSGKKYKSCCLAEQARPSQSLHYHRLSEAYNRLVDRLVPYAIRKFGKEVLDVAMEEFLLWPDPDDEIGEGALDRFGAIFVPWFLFNWEYDAPSNEVKLPGPEGRTVAELYTQDHRKKLDSFEQKLIESINRKPYTFLEVEQVDHGTGMRLKDVLKGDSIEVQERSGSQYVQPGDLVFGRAVSVDGVGMIVGLGPTIIPPRHKPEIITLRMQLSSGASFVTDGTLKEWDIEIRDLFLDIDHALNAMPKMCNTDGDPLELHRLIYEVSSADEAFEKLCDLYKGTMSFLTRNLRRIQGEKGTPPGTANREVPILDTFFREGCMRAMVIAVMMALSLVFPCWADDDFKEGAQNVGQGFKQIGEGTGHAVKEAGKEVGKAFKKGGTEVGQGVSKMAKHTGQQAKETSKSVGEWFKDMGKKTGEAFKQVGREIRELFTSD